MNIIKRLRKWILRGLDAEVALLERRVRDQEKRLAEHSAGIEDESYPHRDTHHRCGGCERYEAGRCTRHGLPVRPGQWCGYWCPATEIDQEKRVLTVEPLPSRELTAEQKAGIELVWGPRGGRK